MKSKKGLCKNCKRRRFTDAVGVVAHNFGNVKQRGSSFCDEFYFEIIEEATECSKFEFQEAIELSEMKKMAYIMEKKTPIGFDKPVYEFKKPLVKELNGF